MAYRIEIMPRAERDLTHIYRKVQAGISDSVRAWYPGLLLYGLSIVSSTAFWKD